MIPEIGDKFIINWKKIRSTYPSVKACKFPELEFTIDSLSMSKLSVYFTDNRTNIKCSCQICVKDKSNRTVNTPSRCTNSIGINHIIITQKKLAIERSRKLKSLGI